MRISLVLPTLFKPFQLIILQQLGPPLKTAPLFPPPPCNNSSATSVTGKFYMSTSQTNQCCCESKFSKSNCTLSSTPSTSN